jgi:hypothetical protein
MRKALFILIVAGSPLIAQGASAAIGDRVRVFAPESGYPKLVGTVVATTPDLLSMKVDGSAGEFNVRRDQIIAIYRSESTTRHTLRGAVIGAGAGAFFGYWFGPKVPTNSPAGVYASPTKRSPKNIAIGAATGGSIGALIGWSIRNDVWRPIRARVQ